jgi:hypothetical protein
VEVLTAPDQTPRLLIRRETALPPPDLVPDSRFQLLASEFSLLSWWPSHMSAAQNMHMQMWDCLAAVSSVVDYDAEASFV